MIQTGYFWEKYFQTNIMDPDGWRLVNASMEDECSAEEFAIRWGQSTCKQPPSQKLIQVLKKIGVWKEEKAMTRDDERKKMERALDDFKANQEHSEMMYVEMARIVYQGYTCLIKAGFTQEQALELIKARGLQWMG